MSNLRDYSSGLSIFKGVDFIFHAAALTSSLFLRFIPQEAVKKYFRIKII